jgi:hypothetical protein
LSSGGEGGIGVSGMTGFPLSLPLLESSSPSPSSPPGVPLATCFVGGCALVVLFVVVVAVEESCALSAGVVLWVWLVLSGDESGVSEDPDVRVRIGVPTLTTLPSRWTDWDGACGNA